MSRDPQPEAERIAALLDGRLPPSERDRLLAELARSEEGREVLALAALALEEDVEVRAGGPPPAAVASPTPVARARRVGRPWLVAAALVLAIGSLWWSRLSPRGENAMESPVLALAAPNDGLPMAARVAPWEATRGGVTALDDRRRAARVGVLLTDLELALRSGDSVAVRYANEIVALVSDVPASGPVVGLVTQVTQQPTSAAVQLQRMSAADEALSTLLPAEIVALGRWGEAARVAELRLDSAFFANAVTLETLNSVSRSFGADHPLRPVVLRLKGVYGDARVGWTARAAAASNALAAVTR